jgi:DUF4097 and DUF4098 domain-containing protein YvlB
MRSVLILLAAAGTLAAQQPKTLERVVDCDPDATVRITAYLGRVQVVPWTRAAVRVQGELEVMDSVEVRGSRAVVSIAPLSANSARAGTDLVVSVPPDARVLIDGGNARVIVRAVKGAVSVTTIGGPVELYGTPGGIPAEAQLETMSGAVLVRGDPAYLRVKTASGRVTLDGTPADVQVTSVSGTVSVKGGALKRVRVETITGDVEVAAGLTATGTLAVETHAGNVTLTAPRSVHAELRLLGGAGVRADPALLEGKVEMAGRTGFLGDRTKAKALVQLRSFKGRVTIAQQD